MTNKLLATLSAAAALAASAPALAQQVPAAEVTIPAGVFYKGQQQNQWLARDLILGAKVKNGTGQIIGDVEDLIFNNDNQVEGVIMGTGGFLGVGEKKVGVRLSALKISEEGGKTVVTLPEATPEVLKALQPYARAKPPKSLLERAMEKAQELTDKTAETSKDAYQAAKPTLEKAREAASQAYEKAKELAKETVDKATEAAKEATKPSEAPKQ